MNTTIVGEIVKATQNIKFQSCCCKELSAEDLMWPLEHL